MKTLCFSLNFLFLFIIAFSQDIGEITFKNDKIPKVFMDGISDTLIWSGNLIISFSDLENLPVEEIQLISYIIRNKDNAEVICGNIFPKLCNPCKQDFDVLFFDIEKEIRQFEFYVIGDKSSFCSKRVSFLIHFAILPK